MLINTDINIKLTNDGKKNKTELKANKDSSIKEIAVAIEMANQTLTQAFENYLVKKFPEGFTDEQWIAEWEVLTINDIF